MEVRIGYGLPVLLQLRVLEMSGAPLSVPHLKDSDARRAAHPSRIGLNNIIQSPDGGKNSVLIVSE